MAKLPPSGADRSSDMIPGLAHTCPQACPALSGGWPAESWTRRRTPRSSWTKFERLYTEHDMWDSAFGR